MRANFRTVVTTLALLAAMVSPAPAPAQAPRIEGPQPSRLTFPVAAESTTLRAGMMRSVRPNHWKRGALIGGGVATVLLAVLVVSSSPSECGTDDLPCGFVIFAGATSAFLLGALPGALIGSMFPRDTL